jgi:hypothetical protein
VFCRTWKSDAPFVLIEAFQAPVLTFVSIGSKRAFPSGLENEEADLVLGNVD